MSNHRYSHRGKRESNHDSHRWVISYADFITLLFAFFVVMYSMSQVNVSKYRVLSDSLKETFSADSHTHKEGGNSIGKKGSLTLEATNNGGNTSAPNGGNGLLNDNSGLSDQQLKDNINLMAEKLSLKEDLQISGNEERVEINLNANILFESGSAEPSDVAEVLFEELANQLKADQSSIDVEGYTDNMPIHTARYQSNWQLSSARAVSVVQLLQNYGISPKRLSAIGYGEFRPIADNESDEGRNKNRRVVLVLHRETNKRPIVPVDDLATDNEKIPAKGNP